ncbi:hypothetical protein ASD16_10980 [Cellulomonas sp. Root485]|uniref:hypothetical protein n=1 Tax=Cellulomonas sp. Root485 TaxID=1736546 RepID=UPI000702209F|nr:hypothetical protein [Cellulomonas sp. Root485]KQY23097.1 hypothetical protein ASD16_10980 [Cellulomonas sp. Root485]
MTVFHWNEAALYGHSLEFLCSVDGVAQARVLAESAEAQRSPTKADRIAGRHPLVEVATAHPGVLLWRFAPDGSTRPDPLDPEWTVGGDSARALREADYDRFNAVQTAARLRRRHRP